MWETYYLNLLFGNISVKSHHPICKSNQKLLYKIFANTLFTGQRLVFVPECHSTNSLTSELSLQSIVSEGTVVITANQTAGRGQRGNTWETVAGMNLTFSILLKPVFLSVKNQFYLNIITSLAVVDFLKTQSIKEINIKWPNDVLADRKKICGILIENSIQAESLQQSIVGIGLNINQKKFTSTSATSLATIANKNYDLNESLNSVLEKFEQRYLQLRAKKFTELKKEYLDNLFGLHERRAFVSGEQRFDGTIQDVNENGELVVSVYNERRNYNLKEISFVLE